MQHQTKKTMYKKLIVEATGCSPEEAHKIEDIMRHTIFHSTLDWLSKRQFNAGAKKAYSIYKYMNSEEGKAYLKQFKTI